MTHSDDPLRDIAKASKLREWATIDAVIEDMRVQGRMSVLRGLSDARKQLSGKVDPPEGLGLVTIHDLPSRDGIEITGAGEGELRRWRKKAA